MSARDPMYHPVSSQFSYSQSREARTSGYFRMQMKVPRQHNRIGLVSAQIPKSFYLVESGMNSFYLGATMYTVPVGNYDVGTFVSAINTLIAPSSIAYSRTTSKMTITTAQTSITFGSRLGRLFGFDIGTYAISSSLESPHCVSFMRTSFIWFLCSLVHDFSFEQHTFSNLLEACFLNDIGSQQVLNFYNPSLESTGKLLNTYVPESQQLSQFVQIDVDFYLLDDDSRQLDFHGIDTDFQIKTWFDPPLYQLVKHVGSVYTKTVENEFDKNNQMVPENTEN